VAPRLAVAIATGLLLAASASGAAGTTRTNNRGLGQDARVCRIPRLSGVVVGVARERAAKAGCHVRLAGAPVSDATVQTVRRQSPHAGSHGRYVTLWVNRLCSGSLTGPDLNEPLLKAGPTELISGLYIVGGPLELRSEPQCTAHTGGPVPGTITVRDPASGSVVASQTVTGRQLATIPLPPGTYVVDGTFSGALVDGQPAQAPPATVQIPSGETVRRDVFLDVP
jgi:hypothetical protein